MTTRHAPGAMPALLVLTLALISIPNAGLAENHARSGKAAMRHESGFIVRKGIEDNLTVVFHVMRSPKGMRYSKEQYHLMVVVERNGKPVPVPRMVSRVRHPDGSREEKPMQRMGVWNMAIYNLNHEQGRHWMTVEFMLDGKPHSAGAYYPEWDFSTAGKGGMP